MMFDTLKERQMYEGPHVFDVDKETYFTALGEIDQLQRDNKAQAERIEKLESQKEILKAKMYNWECRNRDIANAIEQALIGKEKTWQKQNLSL